MQSLHRTRPESLDDLTIQVAIVRPGPILGGAVNPYIARRQQLREDPDFVVPYDHPSLEPVLQRHARDDHLPGPGDRGRDGVRRLLARGGRGAAAGDEPQALRGGDRGLPPALRRGRGGDARGRRGDGRARLHDDRRLLGLRLPQGARGGVRPARLPVDLAARALLPRVPVRAAQRAADGLLRARHARARGAARRGSSCIAPDVNLSDAECTVRTTDRAGSGSGSTTCSARGRTRSRRSSPPARRAVRSARWPTSPRGRAPAGRRSTGWRGPGACDALAARPPRAGRHAGPRSPARAGPVAARRRVAGHADGARGPSSRCRSTLPGAPALRPLAPGSRWSPTTPPRA